MLVASAAGEDGAQFAQLLADARQNLHDAQKDAGICKLWQSELHVSVLTQCKDEPTEFTVHSVMLPCPVFMGDRGTGEVTCAIISEQELIPGIDEIRKRCGVVSCDAVTCDKAIPNDRCEEARYFDNQFPRLRLPCCCHICGTAQGKAFGSVQDALSGIIAFFLNLRESGGISGFRFALRQELLESAVIKRGSPPGNLALDTRKNALLDLVCPLPSGRVRFSKAKHRRWQLKMLLNSDWESDQIVWYVGAAFQPDVEAWAKHVSCVLLPSCIQIQANGITR